MKRFGCFLVLSLLCFGVAFAQEKAKAPEKATAPEKAQGATLYMVDVSTEVVAVKSSKVFHRASCTAAKNITAKNKVVFNTAEEAVAAGYTPCKACNPGARKHSAKGIEKKPLESKAAEKKAPEQKPTEGKK